MEPRLKREYIDTVRPALTKKFEYSNIMEVPKLDKIVVNMGVGEAIQNTKVLDAAIDDLATIVGQRPVVTRAKRSISNFKLRVGMAVGCRATLRRAKMYEFLDRLINVAMPRIRDFRGLSTKSFDGHGNYSLGLTEQIIFPEIDYDKVERIYGMDVTIVTTANTDEEALELLKIFGVPFRTA
jgi:large subunit ribosomal protein L5